MTIADLTTHTRSLDVEIRAGNEGRTFTGIGVPYGETIELWGEKERFEPGAVQLDPRGVPSLVLWQHEEPIGKITAGRDVDAGFEITGALSDTERGREASTLLKDGVITRLSIGFRPREYRIEVDDDGTETIVHTSVDALEFSLVSFPAYSSATINTVRHQQEEPPMPTTDTITRADLDQIAGRLDSQDTALDDLERSMSKIAADTGRRGPAAPRFRSMGDYLKKAAAGDETALEFHRAFTGDEGTTDDTVWNETHIGTFIKWVQDRRRLVNLFSTGALPSNGMSVEYAQLTENTTTVAQQAAQGDDLAGPGKVVLGTKSAGIDTYGGWTRLSRQVIERSELPYLDTVMTALGIEYARATNAAAGNAIKNLVTGRMAAGIEIPANATAYDWRDAIIDAGEYYDENGFTLTGLMVSKAVFKQLNRLEYAGIPALTVRDKNDEFSGSLNLPNGSGELARVDVHVIYDAPDNYMSFFDPIAVKTLESPGAPTRLQDDNIINLSRDFSLYGYMSVIAPFPTALLPLYSATA